MERNKKSAGEDDAATDKEESKGVREKEETENEAEIPQSSPGSRTAVIPHVASLHKEESKEDLEKKLHSLKGPPHRIPNILTQDTFTAWEKKPPSREERSYPPRFSRTLSSLSEEPPASQKSDLAMASPKEELESFVSRPSLREQPNGHSRGMSVVFSAPPCLHPQQIPSVETVETEPKRLEDDISSFSRDTEDLSVPSTCPSVDPKKEDMAAAPTRREAAKVHSRHAKVDLPVDAVPSRPDTSASVWKMGQRISHWRLAHQRGYAIDQMTQDKLQKNAIMKHERDSKGTVPLPLQEVIEKEALEILKGTLKAYQKNLGVNHALTLELEEQAERLHLRLKGRGVIN